MAVIERAGYNLPPRRSLREVLPLLGALIGAAKENSAQVIFVGNVGTHGLGRVLGSVATGVIHNAPCDVYVVRTVN